MNVTPTTNLRCVVERITYQNPENGYSVLKVRVKGYSDLVTLVGSLLEVPVGSVLLCRGEWKGRFRGGYLLHDRPAHSHTRDTVPDRCSAQKRLVHDKDVERQIPFWRAAHKRSLPNLV